MNVCMCNSTKQLYLIAILIVGGLGRVAEYPVDVSMQNVGVVVVGHHQLRRHAEEQRLLLRRDAGRHTRQTVLLYIHTYIH